MSKTEDKSAARSAPHDRPDTLERLLSHCAALTPDKQALADPPNRNRLEGRSDNQPTRSYTFKTLDDTVTKLAARFGSLGLYAGDYVGLQLPNFVEAPIFMLALMRAGLVPCLYPLSWSNEEISRSIERLKPVALISCGQIEGANYSNNMRELAFMNLSVRHVLGAGYDIATGITDLSPALDPLANTTAPEPLSKRPTTSLNDLTLVTFIDPITPVPHNNGQILSTGLLHVLSLGLSANDHILSAYPASSIPGLAAHIYPWLMAGCSLSLHHPFQFDVLQEQLNTGDFSYFAAPQQVIEWMLRTDIPAPQKLAIVRRDSHLPLKDLQLPASLQLFDLWNLGGLGAVPSNYSPDSATGLFVDGQICLPSTNNAQLCLAAAKIFEDRLFIKGRIFPGPSSVNTSLEFFSLNKRFDKDWVDTGLAAFHGPDNSILLGGDAPLDLQKVAS
jgi:acyl-CoA synthetase (AMP-forming)/AMP-acid ligase II